MATAKLNVTTIQNLQTEAQKRAQKAFHAGVGVTDLAVEVVRDYAAEASKRLSEVQKSVTSFDPKAARKQAAKDAKARRTAIEKRVADLRAEAVAVPTRVQQTIDANVSTATDAYGDLVKRGETLVRRIRRQKSTQDTVAAAETTVAKAKTTRTQATTAAKKSTTAAKKASATKRTAARSSAKATRTSAKKTVSAGSRALTDAAKKIGD
jgi:DNA-binding protein HU-beta